MVIQNESMLDIMEKLSRKSYLDMDGLDQEWNNFFMTIYPYIVDKYNILPDVSHNPDRDNTENYKLTDFHFKTPGIEEFPIGHYEMTNVCKRNNKDELLNFLTKEELIATIDNCYSKKNEKKYQIPSGIGGLILTTALTNSKLQPLDIIKIFKEKNGNFDVIILLCAKKIEYNENFILIYNKILNTGYEIHLKITDKITIEKDILINLSENSFYDRMSNICM